MADRITAGTMSADRIRGGELILGGDDNDYGVFRVLSGKTGPNNIETPLVDLDNEGLMFFNPYAGSVSGGLRVGGVAKNQDGKTEYDENGADDMLVRGYHTVVISAQDDMYLLTTGSGKLYTGDDQASAQAGESITLGWNNQQLTFKNGLLVAHT